MKHLIKLLNYSVCLLTLALLTGCFPYPHTTPRSPAVSGRVLDANTHTPIEGATVCLVQSPHHTTYTGANGSFHLEATRNFHWAYNEGGGWPNNKDNYVEISHTNYMSYGFFDIFGGNAGDILLKPKP